jgi:hypothetical protein
VFPFVLQTLFRVVRVVNDPVEKSASATIREKQVAARPKCLGDALCDRPGRVARIVIHTARPHAPGEPSCYRRSVVRLRTVLDRNADPRADGYPC